MTNFAYVPYDTKFTSITRNNREILQLHNFPRSKSMSFTKVESLVVLKYRCESVQTSLILMRSADRICFYYKVFNVQYLEHKYQYIYFGVSVASVSFRSSLISASPERNDTDLSHVSYSLLNLSGTVCTGYGTIAEIWELFVVLSENICTKLSIDLGKSVEWMFHNDRSADIRRFRRETRPSNLLKKLVFII